jgi:pilus assembly protein CpaF
VSAEPTARLVAAARRTLRGVAADLDEAELARLARAVAPAAGTAGLLAQLDAAKPQLYGAGALEPLLADPAVTDVLVNGGGAVWVDRGRGLERSSVCFDDESAVRRLAQRLAAACGRRLDDAAPFVDARLHDGTRVHAVLPPLAPQGTCLSLRVPPRRTFTLDQLVAAGSLPAAGAEVLDRLVRARVAFVVSGGTGTGKTTLLSTLLSLVDPRERVVLVEDACELRPVHPHVVRLEARRANAEGAGAVDLDLLVRQALRMRPDRIVVGEVRGAEVVDLLAALNTGHDGGAGTVHANRAEDVPVRFEALAAAAGLARDAAHAQLAAALRCVVHLVRDAAGARRVAGVAVLGRDPDGHVVAVPAVRFAADQLSAGPAAERLEQLLGRGG